ncbi:MAG: hypothetical protein H6718_33700 [Polyangiaceae bacterium]|nr:hypothetical protein [Myxococcales bacterium]MCB9590414.1 hypothetical protein [Polyangiaceae bacterium]MCB9608407.1 hypothetical protein [Polyangiaceae bacterium]
MPLSRLVPARPSLLIGFLLVGVMAGPTGCSSKPPESPLVGEVVRCEADESREYYCEDLLPRASSRPAPAPYESCPSFVEDPAGELADAPTNASFDKQYTAYTRKRMPPGHSCCYSWCSKLNVLAPDSFNAYAACDSALAMRETLCFEAPESGTSQPAPQPFDACPTAVKPPPGSSFAVPQGAIFDLESTTQKRAQGFSQCCYSWCSIAPGATGVQGG